MDLNQFIGNFASQFEETNANKFAADTKFKQLCEWSSLIALSIIAMVDEEYDVRIKGDDIRDVITIEELFRVIADRKCRTI